MATWLIVVLALVALLAVLAVGGAMANSRRRRAGGERFQVDLDRADRDLAAAHASDRGWERGALEAAARQAIEERRPGVVVQEVFLVQVLDRPGVDEDKAVFRIYTSEAEVRVVLGRAGGDWVPEELDGLA